jgi:hypothetical protein
VFQSFYFSTVTSCFSVWHTQQVHLHTPFPYIHLLTAVIVSPLWWYTSIQNGGFGFTPIQISSFVSLVGISQAIWLLFVFPPLQNKVGTGAILRGCLYFWPLFFAIAPLGNWLLRHEWTTTFWVFAIFLQISGSGVSMAFSKLIPTSYHKGLYIGLLLTDI